MPRRSPRSTWPLIALSVALAALTLPATSALASEPRVVVAGSSPIPSSDTVVNQTITTSFDVVLDQPRQAALTAFIASLSSTASPNYHRYVTPTQFAQQFGASSSEVAAVRSYLAGYGLHVGTLSKGHIVLHVSGLTSDISHAFNAPVATVRRSDGMLAAQFQTKATLPASIAGDVASVTGLSSVVPPSPSSLLSHAIGSVATVGSCPGAANGASAASTSANSLGGYTPQQQAQLYGFSGAWASGNTGVGQTIGVYELGSYNPSNLTTYDNCYQISPTVTAINVDGGALGGFSDEATMDVEEASALAPGATIEVYTGPNTATGPTDVYQQMADDNTATVITTSWGDCEVDPTGGLSAEQAIFEQMAAQGQTVIAAAGDNGSSDCAGITTNSPAVDDPSSQPYVTGVGGLTVTNISPLSQTVWNDGTNSGGGAGGGGASQIWSRPTWQNVPGVTNAMRMVPDLSVMANPSTGFIQYYTGSGTGFCHRSCSSGWSGIGGTSIGAPLVSALVAVAAQSCSAAQPGFRLGFINPSLYAMASTGFNDVTTGNNDLFGVGAYSAGVGYDMASGLGSPKAGTFMAGLCPTKLDLTKSSFTGAATTTAVPATLSVTLRDVNNNPIANASVHVDATSSSATVEIDGSPTSQTGAGIASYDVTTNATGTATIDVSASSPGPVDVTVSYQGQSVYSTTLNFTKAPAATATAPGKPSIMKITALVGGFKLIVRAPVRPGGSAITYYQYSTDGGSTWVSFAKKSTSAATRRLTKGRTYRVIIRALNASGPGPASGPSSVTTRK